MQPGKKQCSLAEPAFTDRCKSERRKRFTAAGVQEAITLLEALPLSCRCLRGCRLGESGTRDDTGGPRPLL